MAPLLGKVTVIKTLQLPKIIHLLTALPNLSQNSMNEINSLFFHFILIGKSERIKCNTLIREFKQGGLNMVHLESFAHLNIGWVSRVLQDTGGTWQTLLLSDLRMFGVKVFSLRKEKLKELSILFGEMYFCQYTK